MTDVTKVLEERGSRYGDYLSQARISQGLKDAMKSTPGWFKLRPFQKESLEMIALKIGRILNGDPDYDDGWRDIAGYAKLVCDQLEKEQGGGESTDQ